MTKSIVLITGAAGFIGSHLVATFLEDNWMVIGVDSLLSGKKKNLEDLDSMNNPNFHFIEADVIQPVSNYLPREIIPDLILHFASPASPPIYQKHPVLTYLVNSMATHHLLSYLHTHNPSGRLLFASTSEVYGDPLIHPQVETYFGNVNPNGPRSCYDESKRLGETMSGVFHSSFNLDTRIVRIFNTYGPQMDAHDGRILPNFIMQTLRGEPATIYGDGSQTRSYCYVDDLVRGVKIFATKNDLDGETINLGNPAEMTVLETAQRVAESVGIEFLSVFKPLPVDDPTRRKPDISKAKALLGWSPEVDFQTGLIKTIEFFRHQIDN